MNRKEKGAVLTLTLAFVIVFALLAGFFFLFGKLIGGDRELQNATDAGGLNVAKQALKRPKVTLNGLEQTYFGGLTNNGQVDLLTYNRCVGQALLVAMNASTEGTPRALANAQQAIDMVCTGDASIGGRLAKSLSNGSDMGQYFADVASANFVRMMGAGASTSHLEGKYATGYMKSGAASNVDCNPNCLPLYPGTNRRIPFVGNVLTNKQSSRKFNYMSGYVNMNIQGIGRPLSFVPLRPGSAPHLVSMTDFNAASERPANLGTVPPNAFKASGAAKDLSAAAGAIVGCLGADYTASIPRGYIVISNGGGHSFSGTLGDNQNIFAQELNTGIFVGPNDGSGNRAYTTNPTQYNQWLTYNQNLAAGKPTGPAPSSAGIYGASPSSIKSAATMLTYMDAGSSLYNQMLPKFFDTYGTKYLSSPGVQFSSSSQMAIENVKTQVMAAFQHVKRVHDPTDPWYSFTASVPGPSGLEYFNHNQAYSNIPDFAKPGTLSQLLPQAGANNIMEQIAQRMYQMKPEATAAEINSVLNGRTIPMGAVMYIYKNLAGALTMTSTPPPWVNSNAVPDGNPQFSHVTYSTLFRSVDAAGDGGAPVYPYMHSSPELYGDDQVTFTPSSGHNNLLGELNMSHQAGFGGVPGSNTGVFSDPN
ncbi:MAG: hypothetical protein K2Y22_02040 [Candidatus Obscuribacterales bacterium]|nr:hypothetical protein [Candidatus Obscuribacterales bacterium]